MWIAVLGVLAPILCAPVGLGFTSVMLLGRSAQARSAQARQAAIDAVPSPERTDAPLVREDDLYERISKTDPDHAVISSLWRRLQAAHGNADTEEIVRLFHSPSAAERLLRRPRSELTESGGDGRFGLPLTSKASLREPLVDYVHVTIERGLGGNTGRIHARSEKGNQIWAPMIRVDFRWYFDTVPVAWVLHGPEPGGADER